MDTPFHYRRGKLVALFDESRIDSLLVTHPANWFYLTGFTGESGALVVSRKGGTLVTDGRFLTRGRGETSGVRIHEQQGALFESVGQFLSLSQSSRVGFDPSQVTVGQLQRLQKEAGTEVRWIPAVGKVESLRMRKHRGELAQMRRAAILAGEVVELTIGLLKPGIREFEVGAE